MVVAQSSLFASGPVCLREHATFQRVELGAGAWVEVCRHWLGGADELCDRLVSGVDWRQRRRRMYDRTLDEPRLTRWFPSGADLPDDALAYLRVLLTRRYRVRFGALGLNYYRDGRDSVAFHADRELRYLDDTLVAIVTLGGTRPFLLRPQGGGRSVDLRPASGDLLVMGGTCQATWLHGVPKIKWAQPRVSVSARWARRPDSGEGAEPEATAGAGAGTGQPAVAPEEAEPPLR